MVGGVAGWNVATRCCLDVVESDSAWSGRIVVEDPEKDQRRTAHTDAAFGQSGNPKLQKAEFQLLTQYRGDSEYEVPGVFKCKVKFEGPSIVDGLKQLVSTRSQLVAGPDARAPWSFFG